MNLTQEQFEKFIETLGHISGGGAFYPSGFEALSMAIAGTGLEKPLSESIMYAAETIANAINNLAETLEILKENNNG